MKWSKILLLIILIFYPLNIMGDERNSGITSYRDRKFRTRFYERSKEGFKTRYFDRQWRTKSYRNGDNFYDKQWRRKLRRWEK